MAFKMKGSPLQRNFGSALKNITGVTHVHEDGSVHGPKKEHRPLAETDKEQLDSGIKFTGIAKKIRKKVAERRAKKGGKGSMVTAMATSALTKSALKHDMGVAYPDRVASDEQKNKFHTDTVDGHKHDITGTKRMVDITKKLKKRKK